MPYNLSCKPCRITLHIVQWVILHLIHTECTTCGTIYYGTSATG